MNCPVCMHHLVEGVSVEGSENIFKFKDERIFYCSRCKQVFPEEDFLFNTEDPC